MGPVEQPQDVFDIDYQGDIFDDEIALEPFKEENLPWYQSYPNALIRGLSEGVIGFGEMLSGGGAPWEQQQRQEMKEDRQGLYNEYLPKNKGYGEGAVERAGKVFPMLATGGGGIVGIATKSALSGAAGQGAEQIGLGPTGQAIAEMAPLLAPDLKSKIPTKFDWKNLIPKKSVEQENIAEFARRNGMTEKELALGLSEREPRLVEELASKGGKTVKAFDNTKQALGRIWNTLTNSEAAQKPMRGAESSHFINGLMKRMDKLPNASRDMIQKDMQDLIKSDMKGSDIINFWQDVNYHIQKGEKNLGILKEDLSKALHHISPELANDFKMTNQLYGNYASLANRMGPDIAEKLIKAGEAGIFVSGITTGNYPLIKSVLGAVGARKLAAEMVINPRLQNMSTRFMHSLKENNPAIAKKWFDQMIIEVGKKNAEAAAAMSAFDIDDFFSNQNEEK